MKTKKKTTTSGSPKPDIRNLSVAVIKPLNCSWDDAGFALRVVEKACVCAANTTQAHLLRADTSLFELPFVDNGSVQLPKKKNGKAEKLPPLDPAILKRVCRNVTARFAFVGTRIISYVTRDVESRYRGSRFNVALGQKHSPTYRSYAIAQDQYRLKHDGNGTFEIAIALLSRKADLVRNTDDGPVPVECPTRPNFLLHTSRLPSWQKKVLAEIAAGGRKAATLKIVHNQRKKKWIVLIPYDLEGIDTSTKMDPKRVLEVFPPGKGEILKMAFLAKERPATEEKQKTDVWSMLIEFASAVGMLAGYQRRGKAISRKYRQDDGQSGAVGHGRARALKNPKAVQAKYKRAAKTLNQQRAAFIVKYAVRWRCGTIVFHDPSNADKEYNLLPKWRWFEFKTCLQNAAERAKIEFQEEKDDLNRFKAIIDRLDDNKKS